MLLRHELQLVARLLLLRGQRTLTALGSAALPVLSVCAARAGDVQPVTRRQLLAMAVFNVLPWLGRTGVRVAAPLLASCAPISAEFEEYQKRRAALLSRPRPAVAGEAARANALAAADAVSGRAAARVSTERGSLAL